MMKELIKTAKLTEGAQELKDNVLKALTAAPLVRFSVSEYADYAGITLRTAQRNVKAILGCEEFGKTRRHGGLRYFGKKGESWHELLSKEHEFVDAKYADSDGRVVCVVCVVPFIYIYIYIKSITTRETDLLSKSDLLRSSDTNDTNDIKNDNNGFGPSAVIENEAISGDYQELVSMACYVCKRSALLLLDEDESLLLKMFKAGVNSDLVYKRYSRDTTPNFWYHGYWKGKNNAWPTLKDLLVTWELSGAYKLQKYDSWPMLKEICSTMEEIMVECGSKKPETAMKMYAEHGYEEIMNRIPGGYVHMCRASQKELRIKIAIAVREIKDAAKHKEF